MSQQHNLASKAGTSSLAKATILGAGFALVLIGFFLVSAGQADPAWGSYWFIKPLIMVPAAGAAGGAALYFISSHYSSGWQKFVAVIFGILVYIIVLWIGTVLGLNGTYWD